MTDHRSDRERPVFMVDTRMPGPSPDALSDIAAAIVDGAPIDWPAVSAGDDPAARVIDQLKTIAEIAALHDGGSLLASDLSFDSAGLSPKPARQLAPGYMWGHLKVLERVGQGRFGVVYRAWDTTLEREVALKTLRDRDHTRSDVAHEGRMMARVHHPNVVTVFGVQAIEGEVGIWMQFVGGPTLAADLQARGVFGTDEIIRVGVDLCLALDAIHAVGLVHRDVKAANVLRDATGRIVIGDFGTGRLAHDARSGMAGTPLYLAPEVMDGAPATPQSDIYSLGVLLFHLATGQYPVDGRSIRDLVDAHQSTNRRSLSSLRPDLPPHLVTAIERATAPDISVRWPTANDLRAALEGAPLPGSGPAPGTRWGKVAALAVAAMLAIALLVSGLASRWSINRAATSSTASTPPISLLIGGFEDTAGPTDLSQAIAYGLERELGESRRLRPVSRARIDDTLRLMLRPMDAPLDATTAREICIRDGGLSTFVVGQIDRSDRGLVIRASINDAATGDSVAQLSVEARHTDALPAAIHDLAGRIREALDDSPGGASPESLERVTTYSLDALRLYSESHRIGGRLEWPAALELVKRAVEIDPIFPAARIWLAWCLFNTNAPAADYRSAATEALRIAHRASAWERAWIEASYHEFHGQPERAIKPYEETLRLHPDHYWAGGNLAVAYGRLGRFEEAVPVALRVTEIRPNDQRALNLAFIALRRVSRLAEAAPFAERLRAGDQREQRYLLPDWWLFDASKAWVEGDHVRAATELDALVDRVKSLPDTAKSVILPEVVHFYLALGRTVDAQRAADILPNEIARRLQSSLVALQSGDRARARELALAAAPAGTDNDPWDRIWVLARSGAVDEAGALVTLTRKASPAYRLAQPSLMRAERLDAAEGEVRFAQGDLQSAIPLLQRALAGLMADVTVRPTQTFRAAETLADALAASGKPEQGVATLQKLLAQRYRLTFSGVALWSARGSMKLEELTRGR